MSERPSTENRDTSPPPKYLEVRSHYVSKFYRHETLLEIAVRNPQKDLNLPVTQTKTPKSRSGLSTCFVSCQTA